MLQGDKRTILCVCNRMRKIICSRVAYTIFSHTFTEIATFFEFRRCFVSGTGGDRNLIWHLVGTVNRSKLFQKFIYRLYMHKLFKEGSKNLTLSPYSPTQWKVVQIKKFLDLFFLNFNRKGCLLQKSLQFSYSCLFPTMYRFGAIGWQPAT